MAAEADQPDLTSDFVTMCVERVDDFMDDLRLDMQRWLQLPLPGSRAARDMQEFHPSEAVETAFAQASIAMISGADHLFGLLKLVRQPAQNLAPWTVTRTVLETSSIALWLLDPRATAKQRVARSSCVRLAEVKEQLAFARAGRSADSDTDSIDRLKSRQFEIIADAKASGLTVRTAKRDKKSFTGFDNEVFPGPTRLVASLLGEEEMYRIASGVAHGYTWSALHTSFRTTGGDPPLLMQHLSPNTVWVLLTTAIAATARSVDRRYQLYGWDRSSWLRLLELTWTDLRLNRSSWFWQGDGW